ncbi:MAG: vWA domain-containing protein [Candidatus Thorarchaeota archaeon]|jgi:hypothetical protein
MKSFIIAFFMMLATPLFAAGQNVVVVLDDSGSMDAWLGSTTRMEAAKTALYTVISKLPADAKVGVVLLNGRRNGKWVVPFGIVDRAAAKTAISNVDASGGTPLGGSMKEGADKLLEERSKEFYGTYTLLVVSDGEANDSGKVEKYLSDIITRGISVDVIGVDMKSSHSLATKVNTYRSANDSDSLVKAITEVFAESSGGASGKEDFQLASAFGSNETAAAILTALAKTGNHPIGEKPVVEGVPDLSVDSESGGGGFLLFIGLLVLLGCIVFFIVAQVLRNCP